MFFFKQKTAYEMRISDWSSDVCSSDLFLGAAGARVRKVGGDHRNLLADQPAGEMRPQHEPPLVEKALRIALRVRGVQLDRRQQIGRASCRERVCQYV